MGALRRQRRQRFSIRYWSERLNGVPAFILGNGPSISELDVQKLAPYFTIGINRAFHLLDPTVLIWQDISLWNTEHQHLHNLSALKVARDVADPKRLYYNFYLKGSSYEFDQMKRTHVLYGRGSTGPLAIQLAVAMGCRPIILLGMDCKRGMDGRSDFYGENQYWLPHTLDCCAKGLAWVRQQCRVPIINCSDNGFWNKQDLGAVLDSTDLQHARGRQAYVRQILSLSDP
jgi:hypothetical protein